MIPPSRHQLVLAVVLVSVGVVHAQTQGTSAAEHPAIRYSISLTRRSDHLVSVAIDLPAGTSERDLQLPVWNALYQVRDFSQYVNWVKATDMGGRALSVQNLNKSLWRVIGAEHGAQLQYEIFADQPGPYGAQLDRHHAFFNLAEILMYEVDARGWRQALRFTDVPDGWKIATALPPTSQSEFQAENYDQLVDSPVELGSFQESDFDQGGAHYRVVVDADPSDYDMHKIEPTVEHIVGAATSWMNDRPFDSYLFIYHFSRAAGSGGGMEHAYSTAIDVNAQLLAQNPLSFPEVTAHEFFHLWNVKRIRPQSLEPIDYTKENYTTALWFSEGVTSTVQDYILLRAGMLDERQYLDRLSSEITTLERRPAHLTQSAEEASLDAWFEKYPYYRQPQRSISYYNKGGLLGVMLDLQVREASEGAASLCDVFRWMNQNYAKQGRFFPDSEGVRQAAEAVSGANLRSFFGKYVADTEEIPWDEFFRTVGLRVARYKITVADPGFTAARNFDAPPTVLTVRPASDGQGAGLAAGDEIIAMNGRVAASDFSEALELLRPGDMLKLRVRREGHERDMQWRLGSKEEVEFQLTDVENITPQQKARRAAWLKGESQGEARP
jgi:predicted metalloprotease with PDZ domain